MGLYKKGICPSKETIGLIKAYIKKKEKSVH